MDSYGLASEVDDLINKHLKEYPITPENARQWLNYQRVIDSSTKAIQMEAMKNLGFKV